MNELTEWRRSLLTAAVMATYQRLLETPGMYPVLTKGQLDGLSHQDLVALHNELRHILSPSK